MKKAIIIIVGMALFLIVLGFVFSSNKVITPIYHWTLRYDNMESLQKLCVLKMISNADSVLQVQQICDETPWLCHEPDQEVWIDGEKASYKRQLVLYPRESWKTMTQGFDSALSATLWWGDGVLINHLDDVAFQNWVRVRTETSVRKYAITSKKKFSWRESDYYKYLMSKEVLG